jgi:TolB protein
MVFGPWYSSCPDPGSFTGGVRGSGKEVILKRNIPCRIGWVALAAWACNTITSLGAAPPSPRFESPTITAAPGAATAEPAAAPERLPIPGSGSLQNPAWSPDGARLLFTRFRNGYNVGPADLAIFDRRDGTVRTLVSDGSDNVNLPGSAWNAATRRIAFSSSRDPHDEIFLIAEDGAPGGETRLTDRADRVAYEPSFSPDGQWVAFESHQLDVEDNGVITVFKVDGTEPYRAVTDPGDDCRQPNWSPAGDRIVYQAFDGRQWDLWTVRPDGSDRRKVTSGSGDKTDASFSPDGKWIVFSAELPGEDGVGLDFVSLADGAVGRIPTPPGYAGAPSWSPDGEWIAFEYCAGDPDGSAGTEIWVTPAPSPGGG